MTPQIIRRSRAVQAGHASKFYLRCVVCGKNHGYSLTSCVHNPFYDYVFAEYDYRKINRSAFLAGSPKPWYEQYHALLPFKKFASIKSLGEGETPLIVSKEFPGVFFKDESRNPSGCFKDRESATLIPYLVERGYRKFAVASSGNAALSASLYGRLYGCKVSCFLPHGTSEGKKNLIQAFGGEIVEVGKYYEDCHRELAESPKYRSHINITAGIHPLKDQGNKIIAYELWKQMGVPDYIVMPLANGCLLSGVYKGFEELKTLGFIHRIPALIGVQMEQADPVKRALKKGKSDFDIIQAIPDSRAEGLIAMESFSSPKAIFALRQSGGFVITISEKSLVTGMKYAIRKEGLLPEWTASSSFSALLKLKKNHLVPKNAVIAVINTGSGLKEIVDIANVIK